MKRTVWAASLIALAIFSTGVQAQDNGTAAPDPAVDVPAPQIPEAVLNLINDRRTAAELSDDELKQRARRAWKFARDDSLTQDIRDQLQALEEADRAELEKRSAQAEQPAPVQPAPETAAPEQVAPEQAVPEQAPAPAQTPEVTSAPQIPDAVAAILSEQRPVGDLTAEELQARLRAARKFSRDETLPVNVRTQLDAIAKAARAEVLAREQAQQQQQPEQPAEAPAQQAQEPVTTPVEEPATQQTGQPATAPQPAVDKVEVQELDGNAGEPEAEKKAKALLADQTPADQLDDAKLRERLDAMRAVMEGNALSRETERALRKRLRADRQVLRTRIAKAKADEEAKAAAAEAEKKAKEQASSAAEQGAAPAKKPNILITQETPRRKILLDRRRSDELDDSELRIRIRVYRDFEVDPSYQDYDEEQRSYWRETIRRDRERLRRRMEEERNVRRVELEKRPNIRRIEIDDEDFSEAEEYEDDVFAAEVDDEDIERVLIAPPKKKVRRVSSVEEIERRPEIRNSLRRIEIDTIRFGFNEAFVREEEIDALDEIALVIERVLKKYPRERFIIEGHTDAVGSDAYNLKLSKARAEAVKKALTSFYLIPARNLATVGLGERYLKIPTAEAEAENRRVSISRATAVLGEVDVN
jgi:outer membrane protein OmpA-like peptidoglycan-associated protein